MASDLPGTRGQCAVAWAVSRPSSAAMRFHVPASTSNLGHGFDCLGMALAVANTFDLQPLSQQQANAKSAATSEHDNGLQRLCAAVRELCQSTFGTELPPLAISIEGTVPIARGLGSSATIIVAVAAAYQTLVYGKLDREQLVRIGYGIEGHPDNVAAASLGGFTVAADLPSGLRCLRFAAPADLRAVLVIPPYEVSTAQARKVLPDQLSRLQAVTGWQRSALITAALASGSCQALRDCFADAWHEQYRSELNPLLNGVRAAASEAGAIGTFLSGSGSTILSLCTAEQGEALQGAIAAHLHRSGSNAELRLVAADNAGVQQIA